MRRLLRCIALSLLPTFFVVSVSAGATHFIHMARTRNPFLGPVQSSPFISADGTPECSGTCDGSTMLQFNYFGGKVIPNAKVYAVYWTSSVDPLGDIGAFYQALTNSSYVDWLTEYSTTSFISGSHQVIGRGTYAGQFTITPASSYYIACPVSAPAGTTACTTDSLIWSELDAEISAGNLPLPDQHSIYMMHFPPHLFIEGPNAEPSCQAGGFCAYHGTYTRTGFGSVYYAVLPDHGPGSGCDTGCGTGDPFQNLCVSASHEFGEAITDAEVGLACCYASPLGWYDSAPVSQGEIGDMCQASVDTLTSPLGSAFSVQDLFSKKIWDASPLPATAACVSNRFDAADFNIFFDPDAESVAAGGTLSIPIHLETTNGSASSVTLAVSTDSVIPAGVHTSIDNTSVSSVAVGSATVANLTISVDPGTAAVRDRVVVVNATSGSLVHSASVLMHVTSSTTTASSNSPICPGSTLDLSTPTVSGATYQWEGPGGFMSTDQNPAIANTNAVNAGTYTVTVFVNGTPADSGSTTVTVKTPPATPTASSNSPVCGLNPITLSTPSVTGATYAWTGPNGFTSSEQNPTINNPTATSFGTYSVTVTVDGCTSAPGSVNVIQDVAPVLGTYPTSFAAAGGTKIVTPGAPPAGASTIAVSASAGLTGTLAVDPKTGVVTISNPGPAGASGTITVTASDSCGNMGTSSFTLQIDSFSDDPLVAGVTIVKAQHIQELRTAIRNAATLAGQSVTFTDDPLPAGATIEAIHITELRTALTNAFTALHLTPPTFTDSTLVQGVTPVKAIHLQELRNALE